MVKYIDEINDISTPSYIFDISKVEKRVKDMKDMLTNVNLCYAMKANPFIINEVSSLVDRLEVCSPGEYEICKKEGIDPEKIIISGVNKTKQTIDKILDYSNGKGIYTIESEKHLDVLTNCSKELGCRLNVLIRLSSGNQFGVDKDTFELITKRIYEEDYLNLVGIHYYSGTQKKIKKITKELEMLDEFARSIKDLCGIKELELEYGPSLIVEYFQDDKGENLNSQLCVLKDELDKLQNFNKITLEFGRFMVFDCGYYCTRINDIKNGGYIILDGGIHQINYYGQILGMKKPFMKIVDEVKKTVIIDKSDQYKKWTLCGSLCTANDVIVRDVPINKPKINNVIIFENVGAYSVTEGMSMFLSRELPAIYICSDREKLKCIRKTTETNIFNTKMMEE